MNNINFLVFGVVFIILALYIGVKKQVWILAGFNQNRVRDKDKLAKITGFGLFLPLGILFVISGLINFPYQDQILPIAGIGYGGVIIIYVNAKLVE